MSDGATGEGIGSIDQGMLKLQRVYKKRKRERGREREREREEMPCQGHHTSGPL